MLIFLVELEEIISMTNIVAVFSYDLYAISRVAIPVVMLYPIARWGEAHKIAVVEACGPLIAYLMEITLLYVDVLAVDIVVVDVVGDEVDRERVEVEV